MKSNSVKTYKPLFLFTALVFLGTYTLFSIQSAVARPTNLQTEKKDRLIDQVALDAQTKAEISFLKLLKNHSNTSQEPILRMKLSETYQTMANLQFRILHGSKNGSKAAHQKALRNQIGQLNIILKKYPKYEEADLATFMRGKAYEELGDKKNAKTNYLALIKKFKITDFSLSALMSLSDFATEENKHEESLGYLHMVEEYPESPQYSFALYKGAWNYYNIKNITDAVRYLERHLSFYREKTAGKEIGSSDQAIIENTLMDLALFFFDGFEMRLYRFDLADAYPYFKKKETGPVLGKMFLRFSKLLRAHNQTEGLLAFKNTLLQNEKQRPETLDVVALYFEHQLNNHKYKALGNIALDIVALQKETPELRDTPSYKNAESLIIQTADRMQKLIVKNKMATEVKILSQSLATLYDSFTKMVSEDDPRIAQAHYNLAETLFAIQDYSGAAEHYRWVIHNTPDRDLPEYAHSLIRAVASRYEVLKLQKMIPETLQVSNQIKNTDQTLDPLMTEWLDWLQESKSRMKKVDDAFLAFEFDAYRALYHQGHVQSAIQSLIKLTDKHPKSQYYTAATSLILDTYVKAEQWNLALEFADQEAARKSSANASFKEKLAKISADSYFKIIEIESEKQNWETVAKFSDRCTKKYKQSERYSDCLLKGAIAHLRLGEPAEAKPLFASLIQSNPESDAGRLGLIERAQILENEGLLIEAVSDYRDYLKHPGSSQLAQAKKTEIEERMLSLTWIAGDTPNIEKLLQNCKTDFCKDYDLRLMVLRTDYRSKFTDDELIQKSLKAPKEQRPLYTLITFLRAGKIALRDRLNLVETLAKYWEKLDFNVQTELYPILRDEVQKTLASSRAEIDLYAKIDPTRPSSIKHRVSWIKDFEKVATYLVEMNLPEMKVIGLYESSEVYREFALAIRGGAKESEEISKEVNEIAFPFEEKSQELLSKSFEIASRDAVDPVIFEKVAQDFFKENPSQKKALLAPSQIAMESGSLSLDHLKALDLTQIKDDSLFQQWKKSLNVKKVSLNLYFLKRLEKKYSNHPDFPLIKALSWQNTGLRSQGIFEIQGTPRFDPLRLQIWAYLGAKPAIKKLLSQHSEKDWESMPSDWDWIKPIQGWITPPSSGPNRRVASDTSLESQKKTE